VRNGNADPTRIGVPSEQPESRGAAPPADLASIVIPSEAAVWPTRDLLCFPGFVAAAFQAGGFPDSRGVAQTLLSVLLPLASIAREAKSQGPILTFVRVRTPDSRCRASR